MVAARKLVNNQIRRLREVARRFGRYASRERYGVVVAVAYLAVAVVVFATCPSAWRPGADGHYSYIYARSIAFDGDIDFTNDYRLCGDPFRLGGDRGSGRPDNIFYVGPAIFCAPELFLMRGAGVKGDGRGPLRNAVCLWLTLAAGAVSRRLGCVAYSIGKGLALYGPATSKAVSTLATEAEALPGGLALAQGKLVVVTLWEAGG
jgi:hypothetical protein